MAEIHVQPKKRSVWPWVLGLAAALVLLWVVVDRSTDRGELATGDVAPGAATPIATGPAPAWVESERFILFTRQPPDFGDMNRAHEYTRNGLRYLASALEEVNRQGSAAAPDVAPTIASLRIAADQLSERSAAPGHASAVAPVFTQAVEAMATLQRSRHPEAADEVSAVREAAGRVRADRSLQEQGENVRGFFDRAVTALQAMGAQPQTR